METGKWMFNLSGDDTWMGDFYATKEQAIEAGKEELKNEKWDTDRFNVGQLVIHIPYISADQLIEDLGEQAYDECGEVAENYLCSISKKQEQWLEEQLNEVLINWLKQINEMPSFGKIENIETVYLNLP